MCWRCGRFAMEGNETLPPVGDSVRLLLAPIEDIPVDLGEVPSVEGAAQVRTERAPRSKLNYAAWAMGVVLLAVLGVFALLKPIALDLQPGDARVSSLGNFSWQSASSVFVFPGDHTLRAERAGYVTTDMKLSVRGPAQARALIHLVKLPGKLEVDSGGVAAEISADGAHIGRVPGVVDVPAGERTLTFKAPRYLDQVERLNITGMGEKQKLKVVLKPNFAVVSVSSLPAGAQVDVDGKSAGVTPAKIEMDSGMRRVQVSAPGLRVWTSSVAVRVQVSAPGLRVWTSSVAVTAGVPQVIGPIELGAADARVHRALRACRCAGDQPVAVSRGVTAGHHRTRSRGHALHLRDQGPVMRRGRASCSPKRPRTLRWMHA